MTGVTGHIERIDDAWEAMDAALDFLLGEGVRADGDVLRELMVRQRRLEAVQLHLVRDFAASGRHEDDGAPTPASWMRAHLNVTSGVAFSLVTAARRMAELPSMSAALSEGAISREHVQVVTRSMDGSPARVATIAAAESTFARAAQEIDPAGLSKVVKRWMCSVDPPSALASERALHEQRSVYASRTFDGAVAINGVLPPEAGATVMEALGAMSAAEYRRSDPDDDRTPAQRRADALVQLCRRYLDSGDAPVVGGVRPHLLVTVPLGALTATGDRAGCVAGELDGVGPISGEAVRRIGCDSIVTAITVGSDGMPMGYGRRMRVVPPTLRKVVAVRDGGCRFPGCDRPPGWSQAHHIVHWADGGPTDIENLVLLCAYHHHRVHDDGFEIHGSPQRGSPEQGGLRFVRPDGTPLIDRGRMPRRQ